MKEQNKDNQAGNTVQPAEYKESMQNELNTFLTLCLPESGRIYEPQGRHSKLLHIREFFEKFWILQKDSRIIGTAAVSRLPDGNCELKCLYLYQEYQGLGYGRKMIETAMDYARKQGYEWMYLDTMRTSERALGLYKRAGFTQTERYNNNKYADVFMKCRL